MPNAEAPTKRYNRTICVPFSKPVYIEIVRDALSFRAYLDEKIALVPEIFPFHIVDGYLMKDIYFSKKLAIPIRRIEIAAVGYTVRPSFVMPYLTGEVKDVENALFFRKFDVPFWAIAHVFGRDSMYWYRMENQLGKNSIVGTTIKDASLLPEHVAADEKHTWVLGEKRYIATTVASECILGASIAPDAGAEALTTAYGVFKKETQGIKPDYAPRTANIDGWAGTQKAWTTIFPSVFILFCFLHVFIKIRDRAKKKHRSIFLEATSKLWDCYNALNRRSFSQRVRRLVEWAQASAIPPVILDPIKKLHTNLSSYAMAYNYPGAHRTSNMLDRLMQKMDRHLFATRYFHGSLSSAELNIRGWTLIQNFAPSNPTTVRKYNGYNSPAARFNQRQYHDSWLENLLISASLGGVPAAPQNPLE